jgi:hypothetical protein
MNSYSFHSVLHNFSLVTILQGYVEKRLGGLFIKLGRIFPLQGWRKCQNIHTQRHCSEILNHETQNVFSGMI